MFPVGLLLVQFSLLNATPDAPEKEAPEPAWMAKIRKVYELKDGEYVKRVAPPYIPERADFSAAQHGPVLDEEVEAKNRASFLENEKWFTLFAIQEGKKLRVNSTTSSMGWKQNPKSALSDHLFTVESIVGSVTGRSYPEFMIDPDHTQDELFQKDNRTVHGDFVIREDAPLEKLVPQLEKILREECQVPVSLRIEKSEETVYVVTGDFKLQPPLWRTESKTKSLRTLVDIYSLQEGLNHKYNHFDSDTWRGYPNVRTSQYSSNSTGFVRFVGSRIKTRMLIETKLPKDKMTWCNHTFREPNGQQIASDKDPDLILPNVTAQTGLKFEKARRTVDVLVLSRGKPIKK
ncbi:MAG: hypothetical protein ACRC8S_02055 [Fimbriiglobus sp.]